MTTQSTEDKLQRRIKELSELLWEQRCTKPDIDAWLNNFNGRHCGDIATEHRHALHLLSSITYFGLRELRVLLRSMFRDLFRYPIVQKLRSDLGGTNDGDLIAQHFKLELNATRFIGMGSPAESGTHLLYYFRQENRLNRSLFIHQHEILTSAATDLDADFVDPLLKRIVFVDDLCGSGEQAVRYSRTLLRDIKTVAARRGRNIEFQYLVLFGTSHGLARAKHHSDFDIVDSVNELDETDKTFGPESRVFRKPPDTIDKSISHTLASKYGEELWADHPLGFDDGQLLLAFHHNIPDNSLPIFWWDEGTAPWYPAFPRYPKIGI